jgi:predicted RNA-binding Zn ribbon-like protein
VVTTGALAEYALLLRDFANTVDVDEGSDVLADSAGLTAWLRDHRLIAGRADGAAAAGEYGSAQAGGHGRAEADEADLGIAIALRGCLREAMREHHQRPPGGMTAAPGPAGAAATPAAATSGTAGAASALEMAAAGLPLRVAEVAGRPALVPAAGGVRGGLAWLAAAIVACTADGTWERLKICADDTCQWAFLDSSRNRSKHWCSMQECGNRSKTRAYRARRGAPAAEPGR